MGAQIMTIFGALQTLDFIHFFDFFSIFAPKLTKNLDFCNAPKNDNIAHCAPPVYIHTQFWPRWRKEGSRTIALLAMAVKPPYSGCSSGAPRPHGGRRPPQPPPLGLPVISYYCNISTRSETGSSVLLSPVPNGRTTTGSGPI